nr:glycosyltransferase [uncultured Vibrio sp.]
MKILYLVDQLYKCGGLERVLSHKINYLNKYYPDIEITICTNEQEDKGYFFEMPKEVNCVDLDINYRHDISLFNYVNVRKTLPHYFKLKKLISEDKPDVIVHCGFGYDFYFLPLLVGKKIKLIKENHSSLYYEKRSRFSIKRFFEKKYTTTVFLSKEEESLAQLENSVVIPNPAIEISNTWSKNDKKPVVIAAGRMAYVKGFEQLIDAWALIAKNHKDWKINIYGDGDVQYINKLKAKVNANNLSHSIHFLKAVDHITDEIAQASIYAMTSITECFPLVLLEAMQCNTPVISFDCPTGPRSILAKDCGVLVENGNVQSFATHLTRLINDVKLRESLAESAFEHVKLFGIVNVMDEWLILFGYQNDRVHISK